MPVKALPETEAGFLAAVVELAELRGWLVHHVLEQRHYAKRIGPGFPDLTMVRGGRIPEILFAELKVGKNKLSSNQAIWKDALEQVCHRCEVLNHPYESPVRYYHWRPEDWDEIEKVLA